MRFAAAAMWGTVTLLFHALSVLVLVGVAPGDELGGATRPAVFFYLTLFLLPFDAVAVGLWRDVLRDRRHAGRPTGVGRVEPTPTGWRAELPHDAGVHAAAVPLITLPIPVLFGTVMALRRLPAAWVSASAVAVALVAAVWAYRRRRYAPVLTIDDATRTLTLPAGRREPPQTVRWQDVVWVRVAPRQRSDADGLVTSAGFDVQLKLEGKGGTRFVGLRGSDRREAADRFAAWLRQRIGARD